MNRIADAFKNKPIFMPYFPLGYPDLETSIDVIEALAKNGADLIEVGLSFSDPLADGPVVQKATQVALEQGITVRKSLGAVKELRQRGVTIPLVLMGYYNPMLAAIDHAVNEGFIFDEHRKTIFCDSNAEKLLDSMAKYKHPREAVKRWMKENENNK